MTTTTAPGTTTTPDPGTMAYPVTAPDPVTAANPGTAVTDAPRPSAGSTRLLLLVAAGVAALVVVALAVALLLPRGAPTYPAGSPEAAFQAWLTAAEDADYEAIYAAFSPRVRATWTYDQYLSERGMYGESGGRRLVWIDSVDRRNDQAVLHVTVEYRSGEGLSTSRWYDRDIRVPMVLVDGTWYLDQRLIDTGLRY